MYIFFILILFIINKIFFFKKNFFLKKKILLFYLINTFIKKNIFFKAILSNKFLRIYKIIRDDILEFKKSSIILKLKKNKKNIINKNLNNVKRFWL
ncbi:MAG: hypothetical protein ACSHUF_00425 [Candidatus Nasuia deltocephalinicola]